VPIYFSVQVSAVGVWGRLLEVASHAADIVAALPTPQLLRRHYSTNYPSSVHAKMLLVMQHASHLLKLRHVMPPYMSRDKLLGRWGHWLACGALLWL
jgi:hypothetical protein